MSKKKTKPNKFKKKPREVANELSPEDWERLNRDYFGSDNTSPWAGDKADDENDDETQEIDFKI